MTELLSNENLSCIHNLQILQVVQKEASLTARQTFQNNGIFRAVILVKIQLKWLAIVPILLVPRLREIFVVMAAGSLLYRSLPHD